MTKGKKIALWMGTVFGSLLVLAVLISLLAPLFIDQKELRATIQSGLAENVNGTVDFEALRISFFPPKGKISNISISLPDHDVVGVADSATAYVKLLPILLGRIEIGSVEVRGPDFRLDVPEIRSGDEKGKDKGFSIETLAGTAYGALDQLRRARPDLEVLVEGGRFSITREGEPLIVLSDLNAQVELASEKIDLRVRSGSNVWESATFAAKMDLSDMKGEGRVEAKKLQPDRFIGLFRPETGITLADSKIDATTRFRLKENAVIEGDVEVSAPALTIRRGNETAQAKIDKLEGHYRISDRQMSFTLAELDMDRPQMKLSGRFFLDQVAPGALLELHAKDMNVDGVRALLLTLAKEQPLVNRAFETVPSGTIEQAAFTSKADSLSGLTEPANMDVQATVSRLKVNLPEFGLNLDEVAGRLFLSNALFKGQDLSARVGNTRADNGKLVIGIEGENPPFQLAMDFTAALAEVPSILSGFVEDENFLAEVNRIKRLEGSAEGSLTLGDRMDSLRAGVEIRRVDLKGEYERIPLPVQISNGRLAYSGKEVTWSDLAGSMNGNRVSQSSGRIDWGEAGALDIAVEQAKLDLGEIYPWFSSLVPAIGDLKELESVKGNVELSSLRVQGPLGRPEEWTIAGKGKAEGLVIESPRLPGTLHVETASFNGNSNRLVVEHSRVALSDSDLNVSGLMEGIQAEPRINADFKGTIGPQVKEWIAATLNLPPELSLRGPVSVSQADLVWGRGAETVFKGSFTAGNGPKVVLNISQKPDEGDLLIRELTIDGPEGGATMSMTLGEQEIALEFKGVLSETTMKQILEENPYLNGFIRGDFTARIVKNNPEQSRVRGDIQAGGFAFQGGLSSPVIVNSLSLKAADEQLNVRKAELAWRGTEAEIQGTLALAQNGVQVDLTVSSEGFRWEKVERIIEHEKKREESRKKSGQPPGKGESFFERVPVNGKVHVKAAYFEYGELRWEPFAFDLILKGKRIEVKMTEGRLCGIRTDATVKVSPAPLEFEAEGRARDKELRQTLSCFLDTKVVSGEFDFTGEVEARGDSEDLLRNLHGQFKVDAGEGRIYRFGLLAKILSVVNITEIFKGRLPDLAGEGFGYRSARFTGRIRSGMLEMEEAYIDGKSMGLAFKGGIDLAAKKMDITVLVTPLKTVDTIIENIPILGNILGDNFIAVPVQVKGDISDPSVIPVPPSAVGAGLLGILERTLKLPGKLIQPLIPGKK
ncbi:MAG: hypothetical protein C4576_19975 [Desulfobacteraceae bacterium]|nr:MAG: hypothetical protein C4576_19975 [Desulfobacteraceae bacterium]